MCSATVPFLYTCFVNTDFQRCPIIVDAMLFLSKPIAGTHAHTRSGFAAIMQFKTSVPYKQL